MVGRVYSTFYLSLLKLACILLKIDVCNTGTMPWGRDPSFTFFSTKSSFCYFFLFFFCRDALLVIYNLDLDFECVLTLPQLLFFHLRTQVPPCTERCTGSKRYFLILQSFRFFSPILKITMLFNFRMTLK